MKAIFDGKLTDLTHFHLDPENRAFQYGDGMFETILFLKGKIRLLEDHFNRITEGCHSLSLELPEYFTSEYLDHQVRLLISENHLSTTVRIKLLIWRKSGGLYEPAFQATHHMILVRDQVDKVPGFISRVGFSTRITNHPSPWSAYKTQSSLPYVLAGIEKKEKNLDDIILNDHEGHVSELLNSNIFWIKDHHFYTPSLETGCIRGVMRTFLLRKLKTMNLSVFEVRAGKNILLNSDYVFSANVSGLRPVTGIEDQKFPPYAGLERLLP
jgi:4-amino-4-deoxychorismate lyase